MALPNELHPLQLGAGSASAYQIEQSLRFNEAFLSRTPSSAGNRRTFTFSVWLKRSEISAIIGGFFGAFSNNTLRDAFRFDSNDEFRIFFNETSSGNIFSNAKHRDISAWYHFVVAVDTTQATAADRVKVWANGESVSFRSASYPAQNTDLNFNNTVAHYVGHSYTQTNQEWQGYLAEFHHVDGTALDHEDFGEYDVSGVWRPIEYTGSYGTNGFYLKFDPSATNGIGHDHSGNGNNFNPNGFVTTGTGTDVMSDTPTTNFCTFNPLDRDITRSTPTDGNLNMPMPGRCAGTIAVNSGKWYWEAQYNAGNGYALGIGVADVDASYPSETFSNGIAYYGGTPGDNAGAGIYNFGTLDSSYDNVWSGGRIGIALDLDSSPQTITFYRDGTNKGAVNIPGNKNGKYFTPSVQGGSASTSGSWDLRMQSALWTDSAPADHKELCTSNLPAPTVKDGSDNFSANLWTGNATTNRALTGFGHQPDFVWGKARSAAYAHALFDSVRGGGYRVYNNGTTPPAQDYLAEYIKSFDSDGITLGSDANLNGNNVTYVGWSWKGGGTVSAGNNTIGDITTTVSANPTAGFSVIKYTSSGTSGDTIGHGLGDAPAFFIVKNIDATDHYSCYHKGIGNGKALLLNSANSAYTDVAFWNNTSPSSTVITLGNETSTNNSNSDDYICWAWAEVEGYSKFGYYAASGQTFVYTGFAPAFVMIKALESANWVIFDRKRSPYNKADDQLSPNTSGQEVTNDGDLDFLSNGFKLLSGAATTNAYTYVYAAFAENPFGGDGVSPATAR